VLLLPRRGILLEGGRHSCPSSIKPGPWDGLGQPRAASSRKAAAALPHERRRHSHVTAEVTFQLMALVKPERKHSSLQPQRGPGPQPSWVRPDALLCMQTGGEAPRAGERGRGCLLAARPQPGSMSKHAEMSPRSTSRPGQLCPHPTVPAALGHGHGSCLLWSVCAQPRPTPSSPLQEHQQSAAPLLYRY